ncbi:MAG: S9 family peptidase [Vicinamibacteria bacterium]
MTRVPLAVVSLGGLLLMGSSAAPVPPSAPRRSHVQTWHGQAYDDPYYWLREKGTPAVEAYLKAENEYTEAMTAELKPFADALYAEMLGRIKQTDLGVPTRRGAFWYYARTVEGLQYPIRCRKAAAADGSYDAAAKEEVLLDQNEMAKGLKFLGIGEFEVSDDASRLLYSTDTTGFRQYSLYVKDLATGAVQGPLAERVTSAEWAADGATVFYVTEHPVTKRSDTLWRLKLGGAPEKVREEADELFEIEIGRTKDRKLLVLSSHSTDTWDAAILAAGEPQGTFRLVLPREKGHKYTVQHRDGLLYIRTNRDAKNFKLVTAPLADPSPSSWKTLVEGRPDVLLDGFEVFRDYLSVMVKKAGLNELRVLAFADGSWKSVTFPEPVYAASAAGTPEFTSAKLRYAYQSFVTPSSVYDYDMAKGESALRKREEVLGGFDPARYASERLWATARDGVKVPISVVYRKGLVRDGKAPLLLYGYGSYGIGMAASFDSRRLSLLDRGVSFAIAHVRGGNEMGEGWHDDGMLMKKKNTFFDFVDCAAYLVGEKWTSADRLLIEGGSAGGLLMGAVVNERPDLFRAVHAAVPFVDVMSTMMDASLPLTVGEYLEWGNPNEKAAFDYMMSYSPYDNLRKRAYPAILVTTSYNDSQVMYWEPAKYVAKLRTLKDDRTPLLLKTKMDPAGHGGASGRYDALRDRAFEVAWMLRQVGITK